MMELHSPHAMERRDSMGWKDFRAGLENLDLVCLDSDSGGFRSWIDDRYFGDLKVRRVGSDGITLRGERSPSRIDSHREELIWICLVLSGEFRLGQRGTPSTLGAGDLAMVDTQQPYAIETSSSADTLWIGSPRALISRHIWDIDELLGVRIAGNQGAGMMASRVLQAAFEVGEPTPDVEANRIARGVLDVLGAAADSCRLTRTQSHYRSGIVARIKRYIEAHLDDETLSVARIASDQGVSPRYLAKMFETEMSTVSGWIWQRRLEKCHAALLSAHGGTTISEIAYAHGFKNLSHFSKAFKERYGDSPRVLFRREGATH